MEYLSFVCSSHENQAKLPAMYMVISPVAIDEQHIRQSTLTEK